MRDADWDCDHVAGLRWTFLVVDSEDRRTRNDLETLLLKRVEMIRAHPVARTRPDPDLHPGQLPTGLVGDRQEGDPFARMRVEEPSAAIVVVGDHDRRSIPRDGCSEALNLGENLCHSDLDFLYKAL